MLFDTVMQPLTKRQEDIAFIILRNQPVSSSEILEHLKERVSLVTVKRDVAALRIAGYVTASGKGRSVAYAITSIGRLFLPIDAHQYCAVEPDARPASKRFDFELFPAIPPTLFFSEERAALDRATGSYHERSRNMSKILHEKELERFVIELSWKSSKIEGNTYTLLDTERLIRDGVRAPDHSPAEALMILNHKTAFDFVISNKGAFTSGIDRAMVEEVHRLLVHGLGVERGTRSRPVGIIGTAYQPLDNPHQIREALDGLYAAIRRAEDPYTSALLSLAAISYIQPFEDGNKRTARLVANALLVAHDCAPLSYRSVGEVEYREAMIVFYEVRSIHPLKHIFIGQYEFAAGHYASV